MNKLFDLSIRARLGLGYAVLGLLLVGLAGANLIEVRALSGLAMTTHRHPLTVSNAVRDIRAGILTMHRDMKDVVLARDPQAIANLGRRIDDREENANAAFELVQSRYLGDPEEVMAARQAFNDWRGIRSEVFDLVAQGDFEAAVSITTGRGARHVRLLENHVSVLSTFAAGKAEEIFARTEHIKRRVAMQTLVSSVLAILIALVVATVSTRTVYRSIDGVMESVVAVTAGDFSRPVPVRGGDELARMASSFNHMMDELQRTTVSVRELHAEVEERKRAEVALRESEGRMAVQMAFTESVYASSPVGLCFMDTDLRFIRVNDLLADFNGVAKEDHIGRTVREVVPELADTIEPLYRRVVETGEPLVDHALVACTKTAPDHPRHWLVSYHPVQEDHAIIGVNTVVRDVTDQVLNEEREQQLEAKIQQTQKLESLGILAGGIAHDFNNLLMSILGNADIALDELSPVSPVRENLQDIEQASRRAADLCRQMLAYSGKGRFVLELVDLTEVSSELSHMMEVSISKKALLNFEFGDRLPPIKADVTQIRQVILNLIINASEAIGDRSGVISLRTGAVACDEAYLEEYWTADKLTEGVYTYLEISDTGCGMDEETQERIFDPFFTTKFAGRGLGMAAVLGIVRGHQGAIKVYSEPGKGTSFKLLFPAREGEVAARLEGPEAEAGWQGAGTVLLVDDEESVCVVGKRMLEQMGFQVAIAGDGIQALEWLEGGDPVCVVLDLTMPHMGGEEAFREIRRRYPELPVLLSSGYNEQEITQRFVGKGLSGFIQKPYRLVTLRSALRGVLET